MAEPPRAEGSGETVGEARWRALRDLRERHPDLSEDDVVVEVLSHGERTMLGRVAEPARVVATVAGRGLPPAGPPPEGPGAQALAETLEAVAAGLGLSGVRVEHGPEDGLLGSVDGGELGRLIGKDGAIIDAVQYLAAQIVTRAEGGVRRRVTVDAGGYRARRTAILERLASQAAKEAIEHGEEIELDPMTPHDRRVIHIALKDHPGVATRSEGDEPRRRIIVSPED